MPKEAKKIIIVEDDVLLLEQYVNYFESIGHHVLAAFCETDGFYNWLEKDENLQLALDVALIDAYLPSGETGLEGQLIAGAVKKHFPDAKIIGLSSQPVDWSNQPGSTKNVSVKQIKEWIEQSGVN